MLKRFKSFILWLTVPIQKWFQRRGRRETIMTKELVDRMLTLFRPGDILGSYEAQRPTSLFIKGFYDHAVIVVFKDGILQVVEAVGDLFIDGKNTGGVRIVPLEEWLYKKDHVFCVRTNLDVSIIEQAWKFALTLEGRKYDYYFSHDNELIYCSELPYMCYRKYWSGFLKELPGDKEILPQYYLDLSGRLGYLERVFDSRIREASGMPGGRG